MVQRLERLGIWLGSAVGGIGLIYLGMTVPADTPSVVLGVFYVLGFALLAIGILGFASEVVVAVHGRLPGTEVRPASEYQPGVLESPAEPAPKAHVESPALLLPLAQPQDRVFIPASVTPLYLAGFFEGQTDAQGKRSVSAYVGKWMPIHEPVSEVQVFERSAFIHFYVARESSLPVHVNARFSAMWIERVGVLPQGEAVLVVGRITGISKWDIDLDDCELADYPSSSPAISSQVQT